MDEISFPLILINTILKYIAKKKKKKKTLNRSLNGLVPLRSHKLENG